MSWTVNIIKNTLRIEPRLETGFLAAMQEACEPDYSFDIYRHEFIFDVDAKEWIDCIANIKRVIEIFCLYNVEGDICFGDFEGDDCSKIWGYRFVNKSCVKLVGEIVWKEVPND